MRAAVTISTNPYQGLKQIIAQELALLHIVTISTNPYQGLKQIYAIKHPENNWEVTISTNPYQGLKQQNLSQSVQTRKLQFPRIPIRD